MLSQCFPSQLSCFAFRSVGVQGWTHGLHSVPSLKQLHVHVMTLDFNSPCLKNAKHFSSLTAIVSPVPMEGAAPSSSESQKPPVLLTLTYTNSRYFCSCGLEEHACASKPLHLHTIVGKVQPRLLPSALSSCLSSFFENLCVKIVTEIHQGFP